MFCFLLLFLFCVFTALLTVQKINQHHFDICALIPVFLQSALYVKMEFALIKVDFRLYWTNGPWPSPRQTDQRRAVWSDKRAIGWHSILSAFSTDHKCRLHVFYNAAWISLKNIWSLILCITLCDILPIASHVNYIFEWRLAQRLHYRRFCVHSISMPMPIVNGAQINSRQMKKWMYSH